MPVDLLCRTGDLEAASSDEEDVALGGHVGGQRAEVIRATTLPMCSLQELRELLESQEEEEDATCSSDAAGFGRPHRRTPSSGGQLRRTGISGEKLLALVARLRKHSAHDEQALSLAPRSASAVPSSWGSLDVSMPLRSGSCSAPGMMAGLEHPKTFTPSDTVILFDWDDTLFPTWFVSEVVLPCLPKGEDTELPAESPFHEPLRRHAETIRHILLTAKAAGRVGIVTLSQRPWVESSANRFLPDLRWQELVEELRIPVIYARECLAKHVASRAQVEEGVCLFTMAKQEAFKKVLRKLYGKGAAWTNVLSIGDSIIERDAIIEVLWSHAQYHGDTETSCKTVKLMEEPTVDQLNAELLLLGMWLEKMAFHGEDFEIVLDGSEENMVRINNQFHA